MHNLGIENASVVGCRPMHLMKKAAGPYKYAPAAFSLICAWLTGKQKNSAPRLEVEKRCLL